jgi:hypothetical protein
MDTVTCETAGCEMFGVTIDCTGMGDAYFDSVVCGSCGQPPRVDRPPTPEPDQPEQLPA